MDSTGFSPPQQTSPEYVTSSGTFDTPEPPAKTSRSDEGAVTTAGRVPVACAVPKHPVITIHRDNRTRTRDERSQAAVSVSDRSAHSGSMLDIQADLIRAREIARKRRERLEAEEEELEIERQIAACSSQRRSSAGSVRSAKSSDPGSPARGTAGLTHETLFQHDLGEGQASRSAMSQALLVPKAAAVARIAEALPKATVAAPVMPTIDLTHHLDSEATPINLAHRLDKEATPNLHVSVAKASPSQVPDLFRSFDISVEDADMFEDCPEARQEEAIHLVRQEAGIALDMRVQEVMVNASSHVEASEQRARLAEHSARTAELQANDKIAYMQQVMQEAMLRARADAQATIEQQNQKAEFQLQQMRAEAAKHDLQLQQMRAEAEHKLMLAEQALSRQASTAASVGSEPPGLKIVPDYFQGLLLQPAPQARTFMPATQTQVQVVAQNVEVDKNIVHSASASLAAQLSSTGPASIFASPFQNGAAQASEVQGVQASGNGPSGSGSQGPPNDGAPTPNSNQPPPGERPSRRPDRQSKRGPSGGGGGGDDGNGSGGNSSSGSSSSSADSQEDEEQQIRRALRRSRRDAKKRYYKEKEFKCPPIPEAGRYRAWMNTVQQNAAVASGRPDDKAIEWIQQAANREIPIEDLYEIPKEFRNLSRECAAKFQSIATGELGRLITQIVEEWLKKGKSAPALVLLRTIVDYYHTGSAPGVL